MPLSWKLFKLAGSSNIDSYTIKHEVGCFVVKMRVPVKGVSMSTCLNITGDYVPVEESPR